MSSVIWSSRYALRLPADETARSADLDARHRPHIGSQAVTYAAARAARSENLALPRADPRPSASTAARLGGGDR
jgi:hypothetical protein